MKYKYEMHLHTKEASRCGRSSAVEMVRHFKERGYTGIFVTDHFIGYGSSFAEENMPWEEQVEMLVRGYRAAKEEGDRVGLDVFFGFEKAYNECHLLTYNLDGEWILKNRDIVTIGAKEYCEIIHAAGGFIVHAHPFRCIGSPVLLVPEGVDAIEVKNACNCDEANRRGALYRDMLNLPPTGGSDIHITTQARRFGIETDRRIGCGADYLSILKSGEYKIFEDKCEADTE